MTADTGGFRLDKTREALKAEHDGFCAWCLVSIHELPHDPECVSLDVLAEVEQTEARVAELEAALREIKRKSDSRVVGEQIPFGYAEISNLARAALGQNRTENGTGAAT